MLSVTTQAPAARAQRLGTSAVLLTLAGLGWWWLIRMRGMDSMSLAAFLLAWVAMMAAMMLPAVVPVVRLYAMAAAKGHAAPVPFFVGGYLVVWSAIGLPAFLAWRVLMGPLMDGRPWAGRLAGLILVSAAAWQLTPLKNVCLRHCRSPLSFFLTHGRRLGSPSGALRMGLAHGGFCLGCCWALMAVLVALGAMNPWWAAAVAGVIFVEKNLRRGEQLARLVSAIMLAGGTVLLLHPPAITSLV